MRNRTFVAGTALAAITVIAFFVLWRDSTKITGANSSPAGEVATASGPDSTPPPPPPLPAGLSGLDGLARGVGNPSEAERQNEPATLPPAAPAPSAPEPGPSPATPTTPMPDSPMVGATESAEEPPWEAAAAPQMPVPPAKPTPPPVIASLPPPAAVSASTSDKVARMQLAARMDGLEPGPPVPLPLRLGQGQARTIYFFTELRGLNGRTVIHRWECNGRIMQDRQLQPASASWRAYSGMSITSDMRGSWRLSAIDAATGKVLAEQRFRVE